jgi:hypothetical protein
MNAQRPARLRVFFLMIALGPLAVSARAQHEAPPDDSAAAQPTVTAVSEAHLAAQRAHLYRVLGWGGVNVAIGAALLLATDRSSQRGRFGFGVQSAAWGTINMGIAVVGLLAGDGDVTQTAKEALRAENGYADILLFNLGLNVAYASVGATLIAVSGRGVAHPEAWRGHGAALIVQGVGLFVLDGIAYLGARDRLGSIIDLTEQLSVHVTPLGAALTLTW